MNILRVIWFWISTMENFARLPVNNWSVLLSKEFFKSIYSLRIPLGRYRLWNSLSNQCLHKASTVYTFNDDNCRDRYFNRHCCIMTQLRTNTRGLEHKRHNSTICVGMYESDIQSDSRLCILFNSEINIE